MENDGFVRTRVVRYAREAGDTCAVTALKVFAEMFDVRIEAQTMAAAAGMHGAGRYGAQCGLLEAVLMFLGIYGLQHGIPEEYVIQNCREFGGLFEEKFGGLLCRQLRPEGFSESAPPHLCEPLIIDAVRYSAEYIQSVRDVFI